MTNSIILGFWILLGCLVLASILVFILNKAHKKRVTEIEEALNHNPERWSTELLDPKFSGRSYIKQAYLFGDLKIDFVKDGILIKDGRKYHFLFHNSDNQLSKVCSRAYAIDFLAIEQDYLWIQGGDGSFHVRGSLAKSDQFKSLAGDWGWEVYKGVPEGANLPKNY